MLTENQLSDIREHLEAAQNPLFLYDNDPDGLCSYVLLRRFIGRGKGIAVRSHPAVDVGYARRVQELNADYVFVLDRPYLGEAFVAEMEKLGIPIVWIDHHDVERETHEYKQVYEYNASHHGEAITAWPVTYWSWSIGKRAEDVWIAMMGCIADHHFPDFTDTFVEHYPDFWKANATAPFEVLYESEIGRLARSLSFGLKDSITHVVQLQNYLIACSGPSDMLATLDSSKPFAKKYRDLLTKYSALITKAKAQADENLIFFVYGGDMSISADIANELCHRYPDHIVVVAYKVGGISNISMRGKNVKDILDKLLPKFEHASGGGHPDAVGLRMQADDLERFKTLLKEELEDDTAKKA